MAKNDEALIQVEIVKFLQEKRIFFFAISNEAHGRSKVQQMQLVSMGLRAGVSDMEVWLPLPDGTDLTVYMEVKKPGGRQSEKQKKFEARCKETSKPYFIVYSVDDVRSILDNHIAKYWT